MISEPLPNRLIDESSIHDNNCFGFYHHHFSTFDIDKNYFHSDSIKSLKLKTGIHWHELSINDSLIDFCKIFDDDTNRVVYLAEVIESESTGKKILSIGSDDGFILWVNGDSITSVHKGRNVFPYDDLVAVDLNKGKNILLYKVEQATEAWKLFRKIITKQRLESILLFIMPNLYGDIPESCIIPDSSRYIQIKQNKNRNLDSLRTVKLGWKAIGNGKNYYQTYVYSATNLPETLKLPENFSGKSMFEIKVINKTGKLDYREEIPVFFESEAIRLAKQLTESAVNSNDPVVIARRDAVLELFKLVDYRNNTTEYSTRMKAHALVDLYRSVILKKNVDPLFSGPQVWGYGSIKDSSFQTYRIFIPASLSDQPNLQDSYPVVFILRYVLKKDLGFWQTRHGKSHSNMVIRTGISTQNQMILVMPHGRGIKNYLGDAVEELPLILKQLIENFSVDTTNISLFTLSSGATPGLSLMQMIRLPINNLGLRSPPLTDDEIKIKKILYHFKINYPDLRWFIWHGMEDKRTPISIIRKWVKFIRKVPFEIYFYGLPHTAHTGYLINPEIEFCQKVKNL